MGENNKDDLVEMHVKFWEPYAVQMAAKDVDVIEHVPGWLPKIDGMTVEQVSPYEILLHRVPSARISDIKLKVKAKVVDEFGWKEEPSNVVSVGVVTAAEMSEESRRRGIFFREPRCMYTEKTPGFVRIGDGMGLAVLTDGTFRGGKVILYLHGMTRTFSSPAIVSSHSCRRPAISLLLHIPAMDCRLEARGNKAATTVPTGSTIGFMANLDTSRRTFSLSDTRLARRLRWSLRRLASQRRSCCWLRSILGCRR